MQVKLNTSPQNSLSPSERLKPMWSPLFNLGIASFFGVIAAVVAFASTNDLQDGGTLVAIPIAISVWFLGDILRWRGRYPMRLFLMVPIFVALACAISVRLFQKANQRRLAWNAMIDAGANVKFQTQTIGGWMQYDEGIFVPTFLADWLGTAVFANSAEVDVPMVSFESGSRDARRIGAINVERMPRFALVIGDSARNESKIDSDVFSKIVNANQAANLTIRLHSPNEETVKALQAIRRPYFLYLSGLLSEKAMRHFPVDSPVQFLVLQLNDPPDQPSWLNSLPSSPHCTVHVLGGISAANLQTIDPDRPLCKWLFNQSIKLDDEAVRTMAKWSNIESLAIRCWENNLSPGAIEALCQSSATLHLGPVDLTQQSVQMLIDNTARAKLSLSISSIDPISFRRLAEVKSLKSIDLHFDLTEWDIQSLALFPAEVEITPATNDNPIQLQKIEEAIKNRKLR